MSVDELILAYFRHAQSYYVKDGRPTSEQDNIRQALRPVRRLYGASPALEFGPVALSNVREAMVAAGRSRKLINKDVNRVRGMFGWAVEHELLPVEAHLALRRMKGLRKGRSDAREAPPVEPVAEEAIRAVLPHLTPQSPRWSSCSTFAAPAARRSPRSGPARSIPAVRSGSISPGITRRNISIG